MGRGFQGASPPEFGQAEIFPGTRVGLQASACFPLGGLGQWVRGSLLLWHPGQR